MEDTLGALIAIVLISAITLPIPIAIWAVFSSQRRVDLTRSSWPAKVAAYPQAYGLLVDNPGNCEVYHK